MMEAMTTGILIGVEINVPEIKVSRYLTVEVAQIQMVMGGLIRISLKIKMR